jgi:hypothetical protein
VESSESTATDVVPETYADKDNSMTTVNPLQSILDQKDLNAAAACLAFADVLESTGSSDQAEFFYGKMRTIIAHYAAILKNAGEPKDLI